MSPYGKRHNPGRLVDDDMQDQTASSSSLSSDGSSLLSHSQEASTRRGGLELILNGLWVLGLFNDRIEHLTYVHLNAKIRRADFTLLSELRENYYIAQVSGIDSRG
jgi:hypothetical protein